MREKCTAIAEYRDAVHPHDREGQPPDSGPKVEEELVDRYLERRSEQGLEDWKTARRRVEKLAEEYVVAIRKWRESMWS